MYGLLRVEHTGARWLAFLALWDAWVRVCASVRCLADSASLSGTREDGSILYDPLPAAREGKAGTCNLDFA